MSVAGVAFDFEVPIKLYTNCMQVYTRDRQSAGHASVQSVPNTSAYLVNLRVKEYNLVSPYALSGESCVA